MRTDRVTLGIPTVCAALICLCISGCARTPLSPSADSRSIDVVVTNNLMHIWLILRDTIGECDRFPRSLSELNRLNLDTNLFVCPSTGSRAGPMQTVEQWTDYIYIGGAWEGIPRTALVISPPENHCGNYGYAICVDGYLTRLTDTQIHSLIEKPWLLDTNASQSNINYLKKEMTVRVPVRLRSYQR